MTEQQPPDGEQDRFEIVVELPPSPQGAYLYEREDGATVHGDASGEWSSMRTARWTTCSSSRRAGSGIYSGKDF